MILQLNRRSSFVLYAGKGMFKLMYQSYFNADQYLFKIVRKLYKMNSK